MPDLLQDLKKIDPSGPAPTTLPNRPVVAAVLLVLFVALGIAAFRSNHSSDRTPETALNLIPLTAFSGRKGCAAFSPDGDQIAFSWTGDSPHNTARHIYRKSVGASDPVQLTFGGEDDEWPAWSPDGREIAFVRRTSGIGRAV